MLCERCGSLMVMDETGSFWWCINCNNCWSDDDDLVNGIMGGDIGAVPIWEG
jgi:hypothetical protein